MTYSDDLSQKQLQVLPFFIQESSVEKACNLAEVSRQTYYEWMKQPAFKKELKRLRNEISRESIELLKIASERAATTLIQLLGEDNPPAVRRAAANDVLHYVLKIREQEKTSVFDLTLGEE